MTDWREELVEKIAKAIAARPQDSEDRWWIWEPEARAALAIAESAIRERCAEDAAAIAKEHLTDAVARIVATAIREGGKNDAD